jgi:hypothetical protein
MLIAALLMMSAKPDPLLDFAVAAWRKEPAFQVEDAYKWLYHATMGGDHAVSDDEGPRRWLEDEWAGLGAPKAGEKEVVSLRPDGKVVRVQLRPFKARGGDPEMLLAVFVASAQRFRPEREDFLREWRALGERLKDGRLSQIRYQDWRRLDRQAAREGYTAIHHSSAYEKAASPAYRVVVGDLWIGRD